MPSKSYIERRKQEDPEWYRQLNREKRRRNRRNNLEHYRAKDRAREQRRCRGAYYSDKRRRRRAQAAGASIAAGTFEQVVARDGCCCAYCGDTEKLSLDHVVALADGGQHAMSNFAVACLSCNSSKQQHPVEAWYRAQPFFSQQRWERICQRIDQQCTVVQMELFNAA